MNILKVENIGKYYQSYKSEWHRFARWFGINIPPKSKNWILKDINFTVNPGEAIGILGRNGAGKSTLLKMITGTLQPTNGKISVNGKITSILELGMGFNMDLTGRQNAEYIASLMGYSKDQINEEIYNIYSFSEIEEYFDKPVRTYSSGMLLRLAFSIATAWQPRILIIDEALAVGDAYFQHKCISHIKALKAKGTSLLIVSHDMQTIQVLCDRAILLNDGRCVMDGSPQIVCDQYNHILAGIAGDTVSNIEKSGEYVSDTTLVEKALITSVRLLDNAGADTETINVGSKSLLHMEITIGDMAIDRLVFGYGFRNQLGQMVFATNSTELGLDIFDVKANDCIKLDVHFDSIKLTPGSYSIHVAVAIDDKDPKARLHWIDHAIVFQVLNIDYPTFLGLCWLEHETVISKN